MPARWPDQVLQRDVLHHYNDARILLNHYLRSRTERLCKRPLTFSELDFLKGTHVYHIMEFFYFVEAYGMETDTHLKRFSVLHNERLEDARQALDKHQEELNKKRVTANIEKRKLRTERRFPTAPNGHAAVSYDKRNPKDEMPDDVKKDKRVPRSTRFDNARILAPHRTRKISTNFREGRADGVLRFSLSDLQRLMIEAMVEQTCKATCLALHQLKLVEYWTMESGDIIVDSTGVLETCFRDHLTFLVESIRPLFAPATTAAALSS